MIDYRQFIQENFQIRNKEGNVIPFAFNETQNYYYDLLWKTYPEFKGIRENVLKFRQPGISSFIDAIFTVDFIMSEMGKLPIIDADIVSHKERETKVLFNRVDFFLDSFFQKSGYTRKSFLAADTGLLIRGKRGAQISIQTANAKVSGRGGTKQNIHWSEVGFYPNTDILNAEDLVLGAEQQVADGIGKIFRESTGNMLGDFFSEEYQRGKDNMGEFRSRFIGWWIHKEYRRDAPGGWEPPEEYHQLMKEHPVGLDQIYWHFMKIQSARDALKMKREYPNDDLEAFLQQGQLYFNVEALRYYKDIMKRKPIREVTIYA